jgi:branched-chain amino acid transport system substrate-binding protein
MGIRIHKAFYSIPDYNGLIKSYKKPFYPGDHDALDDKDYIWVRFEGSDVRYL